MRGWGNDLKALCNYLVSKNGLCLWLEQFDYKHVAKINNQQEEVLTIDSTHSDIKSSVCCLINYTYTMRDNTFSRNPATLLSIVHS